MNGWGRTARRTRRLLLLRLSSQPSLMTGSVSWCASTRSRDGDDALAATGELILPTAVQTMHARKKQRGTPHPKQRETPHTKRTPKARRHSARHARHPLRQGTRSRRDPFRRAEKGPFPQRVCLSLRPAKMLCPGPLHGNRMRVTVEKRSRQPCLWWRSSAKRLVSCSPAHHHHLCHC